MNKAIDDRNFLVLSDFKKRCVDLRLTVGQSLSNLSEDYQKELVLCYPKIILSFPKRSKDLILTAVAVDYNLVSDLDVSEIDDEILLLAIEKCNEFSERPSYSIEIVLRKKRFSQEVQDLVIKYWISELSSYWFKESDFSQESLLSIISKRPKLFKDLAHNCLFEACEKAILKSYDNIEHLYLCGNLSDLEILKLSKLALSRNENALRYISVVQSKTVPEALILLDKKIKLCGLIDSKSGVING